MREFSPSHALLITALFFVVAIPFAAPTIVPIPTTVEELAGEPWAKTDGLSPQYGEGTVEGISGWVKALFKEGGIETTGTPWQITLDAPAEEVGDEGYSLEISKESWKLEAATMTGLFYGVQTARQLLVTSSSQIEAIKITDKPRVTWRGVMLDIARNYLGIDYLKRLIDQMATVKLNRLHIHLTDDQGWRIEIKSYPKLTEIGSESSVAGPSTHGFITQEEWGQLNQYALARAVVIVPEIDLPGHTHAVKASYPSFGCGTTPWSGWPYRDIEVGFSQLCWTEEVKTFLREMLAEVAEMTPGNWIHLGGDEVLGGMANYNDAIGYIEQIINNHGKVAVGWEEAARGYQNQTSIQQIWQRGTVAGVPYWINSDCQTLYLDHSDGGSLPAGTQWMNWCQPRAENVSSAYNAQPGTIGIEGALWSEYNSAPEHAEEKYFPRIIAIAEAGWSPLGKRNMTDFTLRLNTITENWFKNKIFVPEGGSSSITPSSLAVGGVPQLHKIYTLDGKLAMQVAAQEGVAVEQQIGLGILPDGIYLLRTKYSEGGWKQRAMRIQ